jgi:hypothetical protein
MANRGSDVCPVPELREACHKLPGVVKCKLRRLFRSSEFRTLSLRSSRRGEPFTLGTISIRHFIVETLVEEPQRVAGAGHWVSPATAREAARGIMMCQGLVRYFSDVIGAMSKRFSPKQILNLDEPGVTAPTFKGQKRRVASLASCKVKPSSQGSKSSLMCV